MLGINGGSVKFTYKTPLKPYKRILKKNEDIKGLVKIQSVSVLEEESADPNIISMRGSNEDK